MQRNYGNSAPGFYSLLESKNVFCYSISPILCHAGLRFIYFLRAGEKLAVRNEITEGSVWGKSREDSLYGGKESYICSLTLLSTGHRGLG